MVSVEKGGILVTSFLWLWILSHGNVLLAFSAFILLELSSFVSRILTRCAPDTSMQHELGLRRCCALPASCRQEKYDHATQQDAQKKHSVLLLIDTAAAIVARANRGAATSTTGAPTEQRRHR